MEPKGSLPHSQEPTNGSYPELIILKLFMLIHLHSLHGLTMKFKD